MSNPRKLGIQYLFRQINMFKEGHYDDKQRQKKPKLFWILFYPCCAIEKNTKDVSRWSEIKMLFIYLLLIYSILNIISWVFLDPIYVGTSYRNSWNCPNKRYFEDWVKNVYEKCAQNSFLIKLLNVFYVEDGFLFIKKNGN